MRIAARWLPVVVSAEFVRSAGAIATMAMRWKRIDFGRKGDEEVVREAPTYGLLTGGAFGRPAA